MDDIPAHGDGVIFIAHIKIHPPDLPDRTVPRQGRILVAPPRRIIIPRSRARRHEEVDVALRGLTERLGEVVQELIVHAVGDVVGDLHALGPVGTGDPKRDLQLPGIRDNEVPVGGFSGDALVVFEPVDHDIVAVFAEVGVERGGKSGDLVLASDVIVALINAGNCGFFPPFDREVGRGGRLGVQPVVDLGRSDAAFGELVFADCKGSSVDVHLVLVFAEQFLMF